MTWELLRHVRLIDPVADTDRVADVLIESGVIHTVADSINDVPADTAIALCDGQVLAPGLVDLYSHSGEPGNESRETLTSLLAAAIAGGVTRLNLLPDTQPALDNPASVAWVQTQLKHRLPTIPHLQVWGAITQGCDGKQMTELAELADAGIVGFADGHPLQNPLLVHRALEYANPLAKPVALWCSDRTLAGNGVVREGAESMRLGLPGSPAIAETAAIAALLESIQATGTPVHLMRLSTARGVELVRQAKQQGLPITASVTWMHLLLDIHAVASYDPSLRLDPPLGNPSDRLALIEAVRDGVIDAIAIDHTPHTYEDKTVSFAEAPPGAIGLELALPLLWHGLVATQMLSPLELWHSLSDRPALCLGQTPARLSPGASEFILFDPRTPWTVSPQTLKSASTNTPWLGQTITGQVAKVWINTR